MGAALYSPCMICLPRGVAVVALVLAAALAAQADVNQNVTLLSGGHLNLDTGATGSSTPGTNDVFDIQWSGDILGTGKAKVYTVGVRTPAQFALITRADILNRGVLAGVRSILASSLVVNYVFEVITNAGNASKIIVTSNSGGQLQ